MPCTMKSMSFRSGAGDRPAERAEPRHVERDVVVHEEDDARAARARIGDVRDHAIEAPRVEVSSPHLDDRAEAAVVRAASRRLDDVDGPAHHGVAREHACGPIRQAHVAGLEPGDRTRRVAHESAGPPIREPVDAGRRAACLERAHQLSECDVAFAVHDDVHARSGVDVSLRREARIVPAHHHCRGRPQALHECNHLPRGLPLERHDRQAHDVRQHRPDQPRDRLANRTLRQDQVGNRHCVLRVDVAGQRRQRAVREAHRERRSVLERVGHREQQDFHGSAPRRTVARQAKTVTVIISRHTHKHHGTRAA